MNVLDEEKIPEQLYRDWRSLIEPQPVSIVSKARTLLGIEPINPYSLMALIVDVSHWTPHTMDYTGVDGAVIKITGMENAPQYGNPYQDPDFLFWIDYFYNLPNPQGGLGVPVQVYSMINPRAYLDAQMTKENVQQCDEHTHPAFSDREDGGILKAWHNGAAWKDIYGFWHDYEEASYWIAPAYAPISDNWEQFTIDELRGRFIHKIKAAEQPYPFKSIPQGIYSRRTFMEAHYGGGKNPDNIWDYLHRHPELWTWCASYPQSVPNVSVAEIRKSWLPHSNWFPKTIADEDDPAHPLRYLPWDMWQFAGGASDWSVYNGTPQQFYQRIGFTPRAHDTNPTITKGILDQGTGVRVRYTPQVTLTNLLGTMKAGQEIDIYGTKTVGADLWVQINHDLWMCARQGNKKLITLS